MNSKEDRFRYINWVEDHYPTLVPRMERKCCRCFKGKTTSYIDQSYPACVERYWELFSNDEEMVNRYWGIVVEAFKKKRPDIMMEYYMIGGE